MTKPLNATRQLAAIIGAHAAWRRGKPGGVRADLRKADLSGTDLRGAILTGADLDGANLTRTNLSDANLRGADLRGTCLDPAAPVPAPTAEECVAAGLEVESVEGRDRVWGWRTARSHHCATKYTPGEHVAPWFSVDMATECHPGIYFASRAWLDRECIDEPLVRCWVWRSEIVHVLDKWRAKRIVVVWTPGLTRPSRGRAGSPPKAGTTATRADEPGDTMATNSRINHVFEMLDAEQGGAR